MRSLSSHALTAALLVGIAGVGGSLCFGDGGLRRLRELRAERQRLAEQSLALMADNRRLLGEIQRLQHDDAYLEQIARRNLQLVRPNEIVFRFAPRDD